MRKFPVVVNFLQIWVLWLVIKPIKGASKTTRDTETKTLEMHPRDGPGPFVW